jgi:hypothetical protein
VLATWRGRSDAPEGASLVLGASTTLDFCLVSAVAMLRAIRHLFEPDKKLLAVIRYCALAQ